MLVVRLDDFDVEVVAQDLRRRRRELEDRVDAHGQGGIDGAAKGGTIGVIGAGAEGFVFAADLASRPNHPAGKGKEDAGHGADGGDGGFGGVESGRLGSAEEEKIAQRKEGR